jgi:arginyl-tRNA synthetase
MNCAICCVVNGAASSDKKKTSEPPPPLIIRKSDGGYLYATTDLAALYYRCGPDCHAHRLLYVTDLSQADHFSAVFAAGHKAGFVPEGVSVEHVGFGLVLGEDGKKIKTREGSPVKLRELLEEAVRRAKRDLIERISMQEKMLQERSSVSDGDDAAADEREKKWSDEKIHHVARVIGIGSVKYADLSMNREGTYKFSYDKMLSLNGNTAPYLLYAYVRVSGIYRRAISHTFTNAWESSEFSDANNSGSTRAEVQLQLHLSHKAEMALGVQLLRLGEVLDLVAERSLPNRVSHGRV